MRTSSAQLQNTLPFKCVPLGTTRRHYEWDAYPRVQLGVTAILIPLGGTQRQLRL